MFTELMSRQLIWLIVVGFGDRSTADRDHPRQMRQSEATSIVAFHHGIPTKQVAKPIFIIHIFPTVIR